uniref:Secreted protein n=1 Tax=Achlya hypogyna TaxID=1202772 RepID=A0A0A7CNF8_ACHHY|nr:secreted protein [Achlya hypogyna]
MQFTHLFFAAVLVVAASAETTTEDKPALRGAEPEGVCWGCGINWRPCCDPPHGEAAAQESEPKDETIQCDSDYCEHHWSWCCMSP